MKSSKSKKNKSEHLFRELQCHFTWNIQEIAPSKEIVERLHEKNEEIAGQPWRNLLLILTAAYELYMKNKYGEAIAKIEECIKTWGNADDDFIRKYKDALRHVIFSVKAFILQKNASEYIIKELFAIIPPYSCLPSEQKMAITAIKAHVFSEYGPDGTKQALLFAKEAMKGNLEEAEWSFLVGKMMARVRHFTLDHFVSAEETECFRHAYLMSQLPAHAVFLAHNYMNLAKGLFRNLRVFNGRRNLNNPEGRMIEDYNKKATNLLKEAYEGNADKCVHLNLRCAKGFFTLPNPYKDVQKAFDIIEANLKRAPTNVYANSLASLMYYSIGENQKAIKHAEAAERGGSYGASVKLFQMKIELKMDINTEEAYERIFKIHPEEMYAKQTCMHAITYYIFKRKNLPFALNYFFKACELNALPMDFFHYVYWIKDTTDVCYLVYNQVKCAINENKSKNIYELKKFRDVIKIMEVRFPYVLKKKVEPNLVKYILKMCENSRPKTYKRKPINTIKNKNMNTSNNNVGEKIQKVWKPRKRGSRTRSGSECSNSSASSTQSISKYKGNPRAREMLDIASKDLEMANRCQQVREVVGQSNVTSLRPCEVNKNKPVLGLSPNVTRPLGVGCSGWNSKDSTKNYTEMHRSQNNKVTNLSKMLRNMDLESRTPESVKHRAPDRKQVFTPADRSFNMTGRNLSQAVKDLGQDWNKPRYNYESNSSSNRGRGYNSSRGKNRGSYNSGNNERGGNFNSKRNSNSPKNTGRRFINLNLSGSNLDSDDSISRHSFQSNSSID